jgi:hypothetical protein
MEVCPERRWLMHAAQQQLRKNTRHHFISALYKCGHCISQLTLLLPLSVVLLLLLQ